MFKLINDEDVKVFSKSIFIKNADFFKDAVAFYDAFSSLCERDVKDLPNYCVFQSGKLCLEGVCFFIKTYASEFSFKTLDLSIDYLKTLYYSIASLSEDGKTVSKDLLMNEYLVYKDANQKYYNDVKKALARVEKDHKANHSKFDSKNNKYAKNFMTAHVLDIIAMVCVIVSCILAIAPIAIHYARGLEFSVAVILSLSCVAVGLLSKLILKIISKRILSKALDESYELQTLKKNKDETQNSLNELKLKNSKILCDYYEYSQGLKSRQLTKNLEFNEILKKALKNKIKSFNIRNDILKNDKLHQENIYEMIDKIANVSPQDIGRFENLYNQILAEDYLFHSNYIRAKFLSKFIENASIAKNWKLDFNGMQTNPFGIDAKELAQAQIAFLPSENEEILSTRLNILFETKYAKQLKNLQIKNIKNQEMLNDAKMAYINHFYDLDKLAEKDDEFVKKSLKVAPSDEKRQIPKLIELELDLIKNRLVCNTLGDKEFSKIKEVIKDYELTLNLHEDNFVKEVISEKTSENKNFLKTLIECDAIKDLGNGEVECRVGDSSFKGFRLSNI